MARPGSALAHLPVERVQGGHQLVVPLVVGVHQVEQHHAALHESIFTAIDRLELAGGGQDRPAFVGRLGQLDDYARRVLGEVGSVVVGLKEDEHGSSVVVLPAWMGQGSVWRRWCGWRTLGSSMAVSLIKICSFIQCSAVTYP